MTTTDETMNKAGSALFMSAVAPLKGALKRIRVRLWLIKKKVCILDQTSGKDNILNDCGLFPKGFLEEFLHILPRLMVSLRVVADHIHIEFLGIDVGRRIRKAVFGVRI